MKWVKCSLFCSYGIGCNFIIANISLEPLLKFICSWQPRIFEFDSVLLNFDNFALDSNKDRVVEYDQESSSQISVHEFNNVLEQLKNCNRAFRVWCCQKVLQILEFLTVRSKMIFSPSKALMNCCNLRNDSHEMLASGKAWY